METKEMQGVNITPEPTFGQKLVGLTFNPSGDDKVGKAGEPFNIVFKTEKEWDMGNSNTTANKPIYFAGVDPVETKKVYTEKDIENLKYVIGLTQMYMDGKFYAIGNLLKDYNFIEIMNNFKEKDKEPRVSILKTWKSV